MIYRVAKSTFFRIKSVRSILLTLLAAATLVLASCSTSGTKPIDETTRGATFEKGVPGGTLVETNHLSGTVTSLDVSKQEVTLAGQNGKKCRVKCGPEMINQLHVGDRIKATIRAEVTVAMSDTANPPVTSTTSVAPPTRGDQPGGKFVETQQYTATITALKPKRHQATLHFPDGTTKKFIVRNDVDLTQRKVGEKVAVHVTVAVAISVE